MAKHLTSHDPGTPAVILCICQGLVCLLTVIFETGELLLSGYLVHLLIHEILVCIGNGIEGVLQHVEVVFGYDLGLVGTDKTSAFLHHVTRPHQSNRAASSCN